MPASEIVEVSHKTKIDQAIRYAKMSEMNIEIFSVLNISNKLSTWQDKMPLNWYTENFCSYCEAKFFFFFINFKFKYYTVFMQVNGSKMALFKIYLKTAFSYSVNEICKKMNFRHLKSSLKVK